MYSIAKRPKEHLNHMRYVMKCQQHFSLIIDPHRVCRIWYYVCAARFCTMSLHNNNTRCFKRQLSRLAKVSCNYPLQALKQQPIRMSLEPSVERCHQSMNGDGRLTADQTLGHLLATELQWAVKQLHWPVCYFLLSHANIRYCK